jgi:transcriptional regulator with XRE-family HTH domain
LQLGKTLKHLRIAHGLTQLDVAERLGVTRVSVHQWENDNAMPRRRSLEDLARLYGVRVSDLLGEDLPTVSTARTSVEIVGGGSTPC